MGPVKAIPEGFTIYDKIIFEGPMTFDEFFEEMKKRFNIDVTLLSSGRVALYNGYLPGNKHAVRRPRRLEDVYREISDEPIPEGRNYMAVEIGGTLVGEEVDISTPTIKYIFNKQ